MWIPTSRRLRHFLSGGRARCSSAERFSMSSITYGASDRRSFLKSSAAAAFAMGADPLLGHAQKAVHEKALHPEQKKRFNIVLICSDQLRADFIGAYNENPDVRTPDI